MRSSGKEELFRIHYQLTEKGCFGSPDLIIEIVSPSSVWMDYTTKLFKYRNAGVREYWIVDPLKNQIVTYYFDEQIMKQYMEL